MAEDFRLLAGEPGLIEHGEIVAWPKSDYGPGHDHANAIAHVITQQHGQERVSTEAAIAAHFAGKKAVWREPYDVLMAAITEFGTDRTGAESYISLLRGEKKFGIVQVSTKRMDIGIKRKDVAPARAGLEAAGIVERHRSRTVCASATRSRSTPRYWHG